MITSFFKKSTPINYSLLIISMVLCYFLFHFQTESGFNTPIIAFSKIGYLGIIAATFFIINFVVKKNNLTRDSTYTAFFYFVFLLFFPSIFDNLKLLVTNFFILLALRRLISLQTLKFPKEKIFDASLWIFVASIFQFWSILFILVVYASIIFHVSRDYRNWLIPFVSFFTFVVIFTLFSFIFDSSLIANYFQSAVLNFKFDYFKNSYENFALSLFSVVVLFFLGAMIFSIGNRPLNLQASFKKVLLSLVISLVIFFISTNKTNDFLLLTFFPLATLATSFIEYNNSNKQKEIVLYGCLLLGTIAYFLQL
jgi:hypothetical protein